MLDKESNGNGEMLKGMPDWVVIPDPPASLNINTINGRSRMIQSSALRVVIKGSQKP